MIRFLTCFVGQNHQERRRSGSCRRGRSRKCNQTTPSTWLFLLSLVSRRECRARAKGLRKKLCKSTGKLRKLLCLFEQLRRQSFRSAVSASMARRNLLLLGVRSRCDSYSAVATQAREAVLQSTRIRRNVSIVPHDNEVRPRKSKYM